LFVYVLQRCDSSMSADVECFLRRNGLTHHYRRLVMGGVTSVDDLERRRPMLPSMLPRDATAILITALDRRKNRGDPTVVLADRSIDSVDSAGTEPEPEDDHDGDGDDLWRELRRWERQLRAHLRAAADAKANNLVYGRAASASRRSRDVSVVHPNRVARTAANNAASVERVTTLLAMCRSGQRAHRRLVTLEREQSLEANRHGVSDRAADTDVEALRSYVADVIVALAEEERGWKARPKAAPAVAPVAVQAEMKSLRARLAAAEASDAALRKQLVAAGMVPTAPQLAKPDPPKQAAPKAADTTVDGFDDSGHGLGSAPVSSTVAALRAKLPVGRSKEDKARRKALFKRFDPNGNGYLSLAEVDKGCRDTLEVDALFASKAVIMRAFQKARNASGQKRTAPGRGDAQKKKDLGIDFVELDEFRVLLLYLGRYLELWELFEGIDESGDRRIDEAEFAAAVPMLSGWGALPAGADAAAISAAFAEIDTNGGGIVLFDEFATWALDIASNNAPEDSAAE
jgi:Ca2+-binding EF-hand superfamily protein